MAQHAESVFCYTHLVENEEVTTCWNIPYKQLKVLKWYFAVVIIFTTFLPHNIAW